jgi:hypothetical protein
MIRIHAALALTAAVLLGGVRTAGAQGEVFLTWYECGPSGAHDQVTACLTNEGSTPLYASFALANPIDDVVGIQITIDIQSSEDPMPSWWVMQGQGECRDGSIHVAGGFTAEEGECVDPWRQLGGGEVLYDVGVAPRSSSQARMVGLWAIRADSARTLTPGTMYHGLKFLIDNARSVFPNECSGCQSPACFVLNRIELLRGFGATPPSVALETSGPLAANRATWRGGAGASCEAVPVRARTWGQVKSLYR